MGKVKDLFLTIEDDDLTDDDAIEVYADSVKHALNLAAAELNVDVTMLDYEILEKGVSGFLGFGRQPYRVLIRQLETSAGHDDLHELEQKLAGEHLPEITLEDKKHVNSTYAIKVTKSGIWLTVTPKKGNGKTVELNEINNKLNAMRIANANMSAAEKAVKKSNGKPVKIGEWTPNPEYDSTFRVEVSEDEMSAYVHFSPPRFFGRHMEFDEVTGALRSAGVLTGIDEDKIQGYLEKMDYSNPLLAAKGTRPHNGKDAYIDYKVKIENEGVQFEEDESGKVDFRNLELLENVVVGQLLAVKVPAEEGIPGRTVNNKILPAKSGKDIRMQYGKGTILSEDGTELTAEINGQVVFKGNKISVEPVYFVNGDVSLETGNIVFLGSVVVSGSVQDNFVVKAAGNIEVKGTVQKAFLEAEGDIIIRQGIMGREEARIESTGGSVYAKFIQSSTIIAENSVIVPEGILHSNVDAGERIYSMGRRARIVGGLIRAGTEVNARFLGADVSTKTEIKVGINPKILQQISELENQKAQIDEDLSQIKLNLRTLETQKRSGQKLTEEKEKMLQDLSTQDGKLTKRLEEIKMEHEELISYIDMLEHQGKICAERTVYPGVDVYIKDEFFPVKDPYNSVKFSLEGGRLRISEYEPPEAAEGLQKMVTITGRRR